jgi:CHASE2 domain-containing sensor protein
LLDAASKSWKDVSLFKNQVVVIGATYRVARDRYATPAGLLYGCEIVAQEIQAEIDGTSIPFANKWLTGLLLVFGGLATVILYHRLGLRLAFFISLLFVPLLSVISNWILFHRFAAWGAMVPLISAVIIAELYSEASHYLEIVKKFSSLKSKTDTETTAIADSDEGER